MSASLTVSAYVFLIVFTVLGALVLASRTLKGGRGKQAERNRPNTKVIARRHLALLRGRQDSITARRATPEEYLAPPPIPQNQFTYMQAAHYLHNPRSPYPISPPQPRPCDER
ncbi:MAG TPA: hypothetical protein VF593_00785 [Chthoniobacteraceae bacterium]|jgi:hypothetical protein